MPDIDLDFDQRRRGDMIRYVTEKYGEDNVPLIITYMTIKSKAAVKDANRILGYPFAIGTRSPRRSRPRSWARRSPWPRSSTRTTSGTREAGELRALYEEDPEIKRILDTARGIEGLTRGTGVHAAGVILSSEPLADVLPIHRREDDGAIITGFPRSCSARTWACSRWTSSACGTSPCWPTPSRTSAPTGAWTLPLLAQLPLDDKPTPTTCWPPRRHPGRVPARRRPDARPAQADGADGVRRHRGRAGPVPARPDGGQLPHQLRRPQERPPEGRAHPPRARAGPGGDPRRDLPPGRVPGAGHGHRPQAGRVLPGGADLLRRAMGKKKNRDGHALGTCSGRA